MKNHLLDVQYNIAENGNLKNEGAEASNQGVMGLTLLVKIEGDCMAKHIMALKILFGSLFHGK